MLHRLCSLSTTRKMEETLKDLWAASYDGWINVPGVDGVLYSRPLLEGESQDADRHPAYPPSVLHSHLFAFGAWNPMGELCSREHNNAAHDKLKARMKSVVFPDTCWVRHSFGFSKEWREPGFVVACPPQEAHNTRQTVLDLASEFKQGAIYEYEPRTDNPSVLLRKTAHCLMTSTVDADVLVVRSDRPPIGNAEPFGM
ncbi:hypothetical protein AaE_011370 [Aphanomyces astaci]|uniref:Uncharacterized protein n=1 Tax=Aphanomyces astaci TaxID=112090 RepID=A0A6A4ZQ68_APHAT|nr:hypothetical protein AaE_011370 [Aphanomyces astaci]